MNTDAPESREGVVRYFNGTRFVYGDTWAIRRSLFTHLERGLGYHKTLALARYRPAPGEPPDREKVEAALEAAEALMAAVRNAFHMTPLDPETGVGATDKHCAEALRAWVTKWNADLEAERAEKAAAQGKQPCATAPTI